MKKRVKFFLEHGQLSPDARGRYKRFTLLHGASSVQAPLLQSGRTVNLSSSIDVDSEPTSEKDEGSCDLWTGDEFSDSEEIELLE